MMQRLGIGGAVLLLVSFSLPAQQAPALTLTRDLVIEGKASGFKLFETGVRVSANGTMLVHNRGESRGTLISADAKRLVPIGGTGDRPGQFLDFAWNGWFGDSLWIADRTSLTVSVFAPDGKFAHSIPIPMIVQGPPGTIASKQPAGFLPIVQAVYPGGDLLITPLMPPTGMPRKLGNPLIRVSRTGAFVSLMGEYGVTDESCKVPIRQPDGRENYAFNPFCPLVQPFATPDGQALVSIRVLSNGSDSARYQVVRSSPRGDTLSKISNPLTTGTATRSELLPVVQKQLAEYLTTPFFARSDTAALRRELEATIPKVLPPFRPIARLGSDGSVLLSTFTLSGERRFLLLDARGAEVGTFSLPENFEISDISKDAIYGFEPAEGGASNLVRLKIGKKVMIP